MDSNNIEKICKMLNVEKNEEFQIKDLKGRYKINDNGLIKLTSTVLDGIRIQDMYEQCNNLLIELLRGKRKIIKKWKPKYHEEYFIPCLFPPYCYSILNHNSDFDFECLHNSIMFKSKKECVEYSKKLLKRIKEER